MSAVSISADYANTLISLRVTQIYDCHVTRFLGYVLPKLRRTTKIDDFHVGDVAKNI